jgi:iron complex transport system ATP-binding protein
MVAERLRATSVEVRHGSVTALADVDLAVHEGEVVGLVGPNGSGKTSLLRVLAGIAEPSSGEVLLDGAPLASVSARARSRVLAYVGQDEHSEMPFTAREVLLLGRSSRRRDWEGFDAEDRAVVDALLADLELAHLAGRTLDRMSGGERQRVLIARALAQDTPVILLDEPTNHLDVRYQHHVMETLTRRGATTVVVLHDLNLAAAYCDRVVMLDQGRVVVDGPTRDVLEAQAVADVYRVRTRVVDLGDRPHLVLGR